MIPTAAVKIARRKAAPLAVLADVGERDDAGDALQKVAHAAARCENCPLYARATQTVFGEGPVSARVMFVGEQPGDIEDRRGHPFVGPAGALLDRALAEAGIERSEVYVTNAVKHFKWTPTPRGKRRMHQRPDPREVEACAPWLAAEIDLVAPRVLVLLGATAAQALLGKQFRVTKERGRFIKSALAPRVLATVHPSAVLRAGDDRERAFADLVRDLKVVAAATRKGH